MTTITRKIRRGYVLTHGLNTTFEYIKGEGYILRDWGKVVGTVMMVTSCNHIYGVEAKVPDSGYGTILMNELLDYIFSGYCTSASLTVNKKNWSAIRVYLKVGFKVIYDNGLGSYYTMTTSGRDKLPTSFLHIRVCIESRIRTFLYKLRRYYWVA